MSISWSTSKAGYDPGQSQSLKITFDSRDVGKVKISYVFKAHSLGQDDYVYSQRRNVVTISAGNNSTTFKYQLHGNKASTTKTGSFYVNNVANGIKSLDVYYKNDRVGTNTPNYGPKSTGKVSKTKIGSLPISDNTKYSINYYSGYRDGVVSNLPESKTDVYKGTTYKISNSVPIDVKNHYVFNLGYTTTFDSEINIVDPTHRLDSTQTLTSNVSYYACWSPQSYVYRFFTSNNFNKSYTDPLNGGDLVRSYTYNQNDSVYLPNLNDYSNNNSTVNEYYKVGYKFNGWNSIRGNISLNDLRCSFDSDVNFYPDWSPINSKIIFNYGFNNYTRELSYNYDSLFDFSFALKDELDNYKANNILRPGYRLVGWVYDESLSKIIYEPFKAPAVNFVYNDKKIVSLPTYLTNRQFEDGGLNLYAVWEYYTTLFIYTNNTWKMVLPYVYRIKNNVPQWDIALTYDYVKDSTTQNPSWKL